jgi:tetratricopeptide (TPR) repeat protein
VLFAQCRNPVTAARWFREAVRRNPKFQPARLGLAQVLDETGRQDEARPLFTAVLRADPGWPQAVMGLAWKMATHPDPRARYSRESVRLARVLVAGTGESAGTLDVLAAALAEEGRFDEAAPIAARAGELARAAGQLDHAAGIDERRGLYAKRQPYREPARSAP